MERNRLMAWAVLAASLAFAVVPFFSPFNGFDPDRFPVPQVDPPVQPAGYAFSIWGVIYLWLILSAVFGLWKRADDAGWASARPWLLVSLAFGIPWLPVAGVSPLAALVMIWAMLLAALVALAKTPLADRWLFRAPVGLYAGWLTAASWVSVALNGAGFGILAGETAWAFVAIIGALLMLHLVLARLDRIPEFAFAVAWALVAIAVKSWESDPGLAVLPAAGALGACVVAVRNWRGRPSRPA